MTQFFNMFYIHVCDKNTADLKHYGTYNNNNSVCCLMGFQFQWCHAYKVKCSASVPHYTHYSAIHCDTGAISAILNVGQTTVYWKSY